MAIVEGRYKLIVSIVSKGKSDKVVDLAQSAGASVVTVLLGHGASVQLLLGITIDPEKEIILIIAEEEKAQDVIMAIADELERESPLSGISFMLSLDQVVGCCKAKDEDEDD
ncbi:MAG: hypothetical protein FWE65_02150 [Eggerthellaceae bacterium]|nr:hypothetical protein [Eggerthellaceae bacterium]